MNLDYVRVYFASGNTVSLSTSHYETLKKGLIDFRAGRRTGEDSVMIFPNIHGGEEVIVLDNVDGIFLVTIDELEDVWETQVEYRNRQNAIDPSYPWSDE